jgi:hypothetical protein
MPVPQLVPSGMVACWHPATASHESAVHASRSSHFRSEPPTQVPATRVSPSVQVSWSLHELPSGSGRWTQPTAGSQSFVQLLPSSQSSGTPAPQMPPWQVSMPLRRFPSLQSPSPWQIPRASLAWPPGSPAKHSGQATSPPGAPARGAGHRGGRRERRRETARCPRQHEQRGADGAPCRAARVGPRGHEASRVSIITRSSATR